MTGTPNKPDAAPNAAAAAPPAQGPAFHLASQFMSAFQKTIRSANLYNRNNQLLQKFQQDAFALLTELTGKIGNVELGVRSDRLVLGSDVVLVDGDRESGVPFRMYREGIRRLTLMQGMPTEELHELIGILGAGKQSAEEDLVSMLWKAALPHVKYVTVDISTAAYTSGGNGSKEDEEDPGENAIRQELNALLGAIYQGGKKGDTSVRGLSIGADDLMALVELGDTREADTDALGIQTARTILDLPPAIMNNLAMEVETETDAAVADRALDVLLAVLFSVRTGAETKKVVEQLLALYDSFLLNREFRAAAGLVDRVRLYGSKNRDSMDPEALKNLSITRQLGKQFTSEQRLTGVATALNEATGAASADLARLLTAVGRDESSVLLGMLPSVQNPSQRRLLCDTLLAIGVPPVNVLAPWLNHGEWFVGRDILYLMSRSQDPEAHGFILQACGHEHPRMRQAAVGSLGPLPPGPADEKILDALIDPDPGVRQQAVRMAGGRKLAVAADVLRKVILSDGFGDREQGEVKSYLMAFAVLGGKDAVEGLDRILNPPIIQKGSDLLDRLRNSVDAAADSQKVDLRIAAAAAMGAIDHPDANAALQRAARSVISAVKAAAQKALQHGAETPAPPPDPKAGGRP